MKAIYKSLGYTLLSVLLGLLLLVLVNLIPTGRMEENCRESVPIFQEEGYAPTEWYSTRVQDNFSDALMLATAAYPGDEPLLERAVGAYRLGVTPEDPEHAFFAITGTKTIEPVASFIKIYGGTVDTSIARESYARYWNGYQVYLKPLLTVLNYGQIRNVNTIVQYLLLLVILKLLLRKYPYGLVPFVIMVLFLAPTAIGKCLMHSHDYYVALLTTMLLLWNPGGKINRENVWKPFLFAGIATAYLDLFSTPTISVTIPLCILCMQLFGQRTWKENLFTLIQCAFVWALGYAGMWAGKWLIALALQGREFRDTLLYSVQHWSSASQGAAPGIGLSDRLHTLKTMGDCLFNNVHINCVMLIWAGISCVGLFRNRKAVTPRLLADAALFLIPALIPIAWSVIISNHSGTHFFATYRILAPVVLALLGAAGMLESAKPEGKAARGQAR